MTNEYIFLRAATLSDLTLLEYWDTKPHVINASGNDDWPWDDELRYPPKYINNHIVEMGTNNKTIPLAFISIYDPQKEETHYWGKVEENLKAFDIWIGEEQYLNKGFGSMIMRAVLATIFFTYKNKAVLVDPLKYNTRAQNFYAQLGFQYIQDRWFGNDECCVYYLSRSRYLLGKFSK